MKCPPPDWSVWYLCSLYNTVENPECRSMADLWEWRCCGFSSSIWSSKWQCHQDMPWLVSRNKLVLQQIVSLQKRWNKMCKTSPGPSSQLLIVKSSFGFSWASSCLSFYILVPLNFDRCTSDSVARKGIINWKKSTVSYQVEGWVWNGVFL